MSDTVLYIDRRQHKIDSLQQIVRYLFTCVKAYTIEQIHIYRTIHLANIKVCQLSVNLSILVINEQ